MRCSVCEAGLVVVVAALTAIPGRCATLPASTAGVSVRLDPSSGAYTVASTRPAWSFGGSLNARLTNVRLDTGRDGVGAYDELAFRWSHGAQLSGSIRRYRTRRMAVFTWKTGVAGQAAPAFPAFTRLPADLKVLSYRDRNFSPRSFKAENGSTPWVLFNGTADAAVVSPAANFMVADMSGDGSSTVRSSIGPKVQDLPKGFSHRTLVVFGNGINATWKAWGRGLTDLLGVKRPSNDGDYFLKYLGYWTDNGAAYYYNYDKALGYEGTLLAVRREIGRLGIPIKYVQLDSWWYQKTTVNYKGEDEKKPKVGSLPAGTWNAYGGLTKYEAHPFVFPDGLAGFRRKVGLPLATHNRWIDVNSPYRQRFEIPGLQATDPRYWDEIIGYIARSGVRLYEQDWLNYTWEYSPRFQSEPYTAERFLAAMAGACAKHGLTMQYCMTLPRYLLQGAAYPNLTNARVSDDRFDRGKWENFLYTSRFASALGIWPWVDTFMSKERENMLLATLSAGVVGFGDFMGQESVENALMAARPDGVLVKPDESIVPVDDSVISDARAEHKPLMASTFTQHGGRRTTYVFAFMRRADSADLVLNPSRLGLNGAGWVYSPFTGESQRVKPGDTVHQTLTRRDSAFCVLAPAGVSGIAFLGDEGKYVGTGKQRIADTSERAGTLTATVLFAKGEKAITLHGFASKQPRCTAGHVAYDAATNHFAVAVPSRGKQRVSVTFSD